MPSNEEKTLSFAAEVKEEIASADRSDAEKRALLSGFVKASGHIRIVDGRASLELGSQSAKIAKAIYGIITDLYGVPARFAYSRSPGFLHRTVFHIIVDEEAADILNDLGIDLLSGKPPKYLQATEGQTASYLAGAFLAGGSVNDPRSRSYHLEIALEDESYALWLKKLWEKAARHQFNPRISKRRSSYIVYIKRSDEISDFLIYVGAKASCLKFEDVRVARDYQNNMNRLSNIDSANMGRTIASSERRIKEIKYFESHGGTDSLGDPKLTALCSLRVAHPDASLGELAGLLSEELAMEVTKSGVNHLFRRLDEEYRRATHG
jgi:DNA-binding protein WhiA